MINYCRMSFSWSSISPDEVFCWRPNQTVLYTTSLYLPYVPHRVGQVYPDNNIIQIPHCFLVYCWPWIVTTNEAVKTRNYSFSRAVMVGWRGMADRDPNNYALPLSYQAYMGTTLAQPFTALPGLQFVTPQNRVVPDVLRNDFLHLNIPPPVVQAIPRTDDSVDSEEQKSKPKTPRSNSKTTEDKGRCYQKQFLRLEMIQRWPPERTTPCIPSLRSSWV